MMAESKLTNFQQRKLQEALKGNQLNVLICNIYNDWLIGGGSLPLRCNPTSSSDGSSCRTKVESKPGRSSRSKQYKSGLRSKETIDTMQQAQKEDCEGVYTPRKTGWV